MELENRVAPGRGVPAALGRAGRGDRTIRADTVRRLDRREAEPQAPASGTSEPSSESSETGTF
jgi:hypothetical protein